MTEQDKVKAAINSFYKGAGLEITFSGEANPKVAEIFGEMVKKKQKIALKPLIGFLNLLVEKLQFHG